MLFQPRVPPPPRITEIPSCPSTGACRSTSESVITICLSVGRELLEFRILALLHNMTHELRSLHVGRDSHHECGTADGRFDQRKLGEAGVLPAGGRDIRNEIVAK